MLCFKIFLNNRTDMLKIHKHFHTHSNTRRYYYKISIFSYITILQFINISNGSYKTQIQSKNQICTAKTAFVMWKRIHRMFSLKFPANGGTRIVYHFTSAQFSTIVRSRIVNLMAGKLRSFKGWKAI